MLSLYSTGVTEECISTEQQWTSDRLLWMWQWTFWVREMWGISWLNDELSASHKTITIWWAQWWTVSFSQNNYNMVGSMMNCQFLTKQLQYGGQVWSVVRRNVQEAEFVQDGWTESPAGGCVRQNWQVLSHARYFTTAYHSSYGPTYSIHLWRLCHPSRLWIHISNINLDWSMVFSMDNPVACRAEIQLFMWILRFSWQWLQGKCKMWCGIQFTPTKQLNITSCRAVISKAV